LCLLGIDFSLYYFFVFVFRLEVMRIVDDGFEISQGSL